MRRVTNIDESRPEPIESADMTWILSRQHPVTGHESVRSDHTGLHALCFDAGNYDLAMAMMYDWRSRQGDSPLVNCTIGSLHVLVGSTGI